MYGFWFGNLMDVHVSDDDDGRYRIFLDTIPFQSARTLSMTMKFSSAAILFVCVTTPLTAAFQPRCHPTAIRSSASSSALHATDLANRLVRANEEKAAAIRAAERRNQADIEALKSQIDQIEAVFSRSSDYSSSYTPSPPTLPLNLSGLSKFELQNKLREFQNYLGTLLARSESNQREAAAIQGQAGEEALKIAGTAVIAGTFGGLVSGALDSNRRDSIGGIVAGVAGSAASLINKPSSEPVGLPMPPTARVSAPEDPLAPVSSV